MEGELNTVKTDAREQRERADELSAAMDQVKQSLGSTNEEQLDRLCKVSKEAEMLRRQVGNLGDLSTRMMDLEQQNEALKKHLYSANEARRSLHNKVQDLRGSIRVVARIRPMLSHDEG